MIIASSVKEGRESQRGTRRQKPEMGGWAGKKRERGDVKITLEETEEI